ncbi:hypothetical protein GOODEAATRI_018970, partial [Goodea atripinnis]
MELPGVLRTATTTRDAIPNKEEEATGTGRGGTGSATVTSSPAREPRTRTKNPPVGKQMVSKMLVIKKVSKEDTGTAFSAGFATAGTLPTNGSKAPLTGSSVYKNLVPKPAVAPTK